MNPIAGRVRHFLTLSALILFVLGGLGQGGPVHAGMAPTTTGPTAHHAAGSMPMDHAAMDGMSDADKAICELQCLALAVALPVLPALSVRLQRERPAPAAALPLPAPYLSAPDGPPPKPKAM